MTRPTTVYEPPSLWRINLAAELARLPSFFDLLWTLSVHRVRVRYKQSRLGVAWAVLQPLAIMLVFTFMVSFLGGLPHHGVPYGLFAYAALVPWTAFSSGFSSASGSLTSHASLLTKVYFPREILPITYVAVALVDLAVAALALGALMAWYGVRVGPVTVWAVVAVALLAAFLASAGLLLSALQVRYRDVGLAMPVILQVWLLATPILYPLDAVRSVLPPGLYRAYLLNPLAGVVDTFRRATVLQQAPDLQALAFSGLVTAALLPAAYLYFKYTEQTMADVI